MLAFAEAEGLAPALGFALEARAPETMPRAVRERLGRCFAQSTACQVVLSNELGRLLRRFDEAKLPVMPLKGPALGEMLYPHPAVRPSSDLDLLVRPETVRVVDALLKQLGYRPFADAHSWGFDLAFDRATLYEGPSGVRVDLHWGLLSDPRFGWSEQEGLTVWSRAIRTSTVGEEALALCPEDLVLYLALHLAVHHGLAGLLWYWDLSLALTRWADTLDWDAVIERASRWRIRAALYFTLRELQLFFDAPLPASVMASVRPRGVRATLIGGLLRHMEPRRRMRLEHLTALLLTDRSRDLVRPLARAMCPPPAWVRARYGRERSSLLGLYFAHYRRVGEVVSQTGKGLAPDASMRR